jgi:hypothetical protein
MNRRDRRVVNEEPGVGRRVEADEFGPGVVSAGRIEDRRDQFVSVSPARANTVRSSVTSKAVPSTVRSASALRTRSSNGWGSVVPGRNRQSIVATARSATTFGASPPDTSVTVTSSCDNTGWVVTSSSPSSARTRPSSPSSPLMASRASSGRPE